MFSKNNKTPSTPSSSLDRIQDPEKEEKKLKRRKMGDQTPSLICARGTKYTVNINNINRIDVK